MHVFWLPLFNRFVHLVYVGKKQSYMLHRQYAICHNIFFFLFYIQSLVQRGTASIKKAEDFTLAVEKHLNTYRFSGLAVK